MFDMFKRVLSSFLSLALVFANIPLVFGQGPQTPVEYQQQLTKYQPHKPQSFSFESQQFSSQQLVSLSTGAALFQVPLNLPQGISGMTPSLSLSYSSQQMGQDGPFGFGWNVGLGEIWVSNDSIHDRYINPTYSARVAGLQGELVKIAEDQGVEEYAIRRESSFARFYYDTSANSWEVKSTSGMRYLLGSTDDSRVRGQDLSRIAR